MTFSSVHYLCIDTKYQNRSSSYENKSKQKSRHTQTDTMYIDILGNT